MTEWSLQDWLTFIAAAGAAALAFYTGVVRPTLAQIKDLIVALRENTTATDTSATALKDLEPAVTANTVVTRAVADATAPARHGTVNVSGAGEPTPIRPT